MKLPQINLKPKSDEFWLKHKIATKKNYDSSSILLPHRYVFVLTNLCNLKCSFCFQARKKRPEAMTKSDWLNFIDELPLGSRVTLTGGEPLVFKGFDEILAKLTKNHFVNIISNGVLLNEKFIEDFISNKNIKVLSISIDDIGNNSREFKSTQWEKLLEKIDYFNELRRKTSSEILLDIKAVIMNENSSKLYELHKFACEKLKSNTTSFSFLKGANIQHNDFEFEFDKINDEYIAETYDNFEIIVDQLKMIREYNIQNNKYAFLHPNIFNINSGNQEIDINFINNSKHKKELFKPCMAPCGSVHINVDGNVFPCMSISMGNVKKESLKSIINGEKFSKFREIIKTNHTVSACNRCGYIESKSYNTF